MCFGPVPLYDTCMNIKALMYSRKSNKFPGRPKIVLIKKHSIQTLGYNNVRYVCNKQQFQLSSPGVKSNLFLNKPTCFRIHLFIAFHTRCISRWYKSAPPNIRLGCFSRSSNPMWTVAVGTTTKHTCWTQFTLTCQCSPTQSYLETILVSK